MREATVKSNIDISDINIKALILSSSEKIFMGYTTLFDQLTDFGNLLAAYKRAARVVHHAIHAVIAPLFEPDFIADFRCLDSCGDPAKRCQK